MCARVCAFLKIFFRVSVVQKKTYGMGSCLNHSWLRDEVLPQNSMWLTILCDVFLVSLILNEVFAWCLKLGPREA